MANIVPDSFKEELFEAIHDFTASTGDAFKLALYSTVTGFSAASTTAYTTTNEVTGTGYTATGASLVNISPVVAQNIAFVDFNDVTFSTATITASAALIYNSTSSNKSVVVLDFGGKGGSSKNFSFNQFLSSFSTK